MINKFYILFTKYNKINLSFIMSIIRFICDSNYTTTTEINDCTSESGNGESRNDRSQKSFEMVLVTVFKF